MQRAKSAGALGRFRVLDISQVRAGPTCVKQLADFGADVIKVEPPDTAERPELYLGERDGADMQNLHRNKRSIVLDLKTAEGRQNFLKLVATSDVVVENFRPRVKDRLGIDYATLAAINPRVILVSMSAFGQEGPYSERPGYDQIAQGMCGLMSTTGFPDGHPTRVGAAVVDVTTGLYAALGALTALLEREVSGKGQWVQTSLLHSGVALMDFQAVRFSVDGEVAGRAGNDHPTSMPTSSYKTLDGFINLGAGEGKQWRSLCRVIDEPSLADHPDFARGSDRVRNRDALNEVLSDHFRTRTTNDWVAILEAADVPCGPIYTMDQVYADPQVQNASVFKTLEHPRRGKMQLIAQAVTLSRTPARFDFPLEEKGGSTDEILREIRG